MSTQVLTVRIKSNDPESESGVIINAVDFDPATMELFEGEELPQIPFTEALVAAAFKACVAAETLCKALKPEDQEELHSRMRAYMYPEAEAEDDGQGTLELEPKSAEELAADKQAKKDAAAAAKAADKAAKEAAAAGQGAPPAPAPAEGAETGQEGGPAAPAPAGEGAGQGDGGDAPPAAAAGWGAPPAGA